MTENKISTETKKISKPRRSSKIVNVFKKLHKEKSDIKPPSSQPKSLTFEDSKS